MDEPQPKPGELTELLEIVRSGNDPKAAERRVVELAYNEMRRIAGHLADPRSGTINATALVHEAWLKLHGQLGGVNDRTHFLALAARAMRQVMADAARARNASKRGGNNLRFTLHEADGLVGSDARAIDLADVHDLLEAMRGLYAKQAEVFELRAFGTLTFKEIASLQNRSESGARLDWQFARAWMRSRLEGSTDGPAVDRTAPESTTP